MDLSIAYAELCNIERELKRLNGGKPMQQKLPKCIGTVNVELIWDEGFMRFAIHAHDETEHAITLDTAGLDILLDEMQKLRARHHGVELLNFDSYETELPIDDDGEEQE